MTKYAENEWDVILVLKIAAAMKEPALYQHEWLKCRKGTNVCSVAACKIQNSFKSMNQSRGTFHCSFIVSLKLVMLCFAKIQIQTLFALEANWLWRLLLHRDDWQSCPTLWCHKTYVTKKFPFTLKVLTVKSRSFKYWVLNRLNPGIIQKYNMLVWSYLTHYVFG